MPAAASAILVVDDAGEIRTLIALSLRQHGYRVLEAEGGHAAESILRSEQPALVISDLEMSGGDGWTLLAFCHVHHPGIPVLIISGTRRGEHPEVERWAADFLPKPFGIDELHADVRRLLLPR